VPLHYATTHSLWHYNLMYCLQEYGPYVKLWWESCPRLLVVVFWTKVRDIGCSQMTCSFLISKGQDIWEELTFQPILDSLVEEDFFDDELKDIEVRMKWQILEVLMAFISFLHAYDRKRGHNMLAPMLNPRFKSMRFIIVF
jgi:hypothetical protein